MPLAADADRKLIWPRFNKPSPAPQNFKLPAKKTAAGKKVGVGGKGGNQTHLPTCLCPTCPLGIKERAKARAKLAAANNTEARAQEETDEEDSDHESEDSDDESEDSPLQSPKKKKVKRDTAKESGSKRPDGQTPTQGGGDRQVCAPGCRCPRCRQSQRVPGHGEGCDCTGCVPHGKGCKCEECVPDAKHGKGCRCKEKCAPPSSPPHVLRKAAQDGNLKRVQELLAQRADVETKGGVWHKLQAAESKSRRKKAREVLKKADDSNKKKQKQHSNTHSKKSDKKQKKRKRDEEPEQRPKRVIKRYLLLNAECNRAQKFSLNHFALRRAPFRRRLYKQVMQIGGRVESTTNQPCMHS
eukprot:g21209.t1